MSLLLTKVFLALVASVTSVASVVQPRPAAKERGDVPGWVLITVMTAGLVVMLQLLAGEQLKAMLERALDSVTQ